MSTLYNRRPPHSQDDPTHPSLLSSRKMMYCRENTAPSTKMNDFADLHAEQQQGEFARRKVRAIWLIIECLNRLHLLCHDPGWDKRWCARKTPSPGVSCELNDLIWRPLYVLGPYRQTNVIPFDKGAPHGAFTHFLKDAGQGDVPDIPRTGKALVPGCGRVSPRRSIFRWSD